MHAAAWSIIPVFVIVSIWLPVVSHYRVPDVRVAALAAEQARREPPDDVLQQVRGDRLLGHGWVRDHELVAAAEDLLRGELRLGGQIAVNIHFPFRPENLTIPTARLQVAGLVPADLLLQAYEQTRQERFFTAALSLVLEFASYERRAWLPIGLLWNDHAIANRVFVLSEFWRVYRHRSDFRPEVAQAILESLARSAEFLADPRHFAFASNHGIMQNVALLRLALTIPALPKVGYYQHLAVERLREQMTFYVSMDGVVLEHSAGYQLFGIDLLRLAERYIRSLNLQVPHEWERKYTRALEFADQLQRPDGSVPLFGDTDTSWRSRRPRSRARAPKWPFALYPVAGYAVWWDGLEGWPDSKSLRQTVVVFSHFPGHAHKHADELSVLLWAGGQNWWTNVGYWPYDHRFRSQAISWDGSTAPHLVDEPTKSERTPRLLSYGSTTKTSMMEAVREGPGKYQARRQIVYLRPNTWLVLDIVSGAPKLASHTIWRTDNGTTLREEEADRRYLLQSRIGASRLFAYFFGSSGVTIRTLPRSLGPYLGRSSSEVAETIVPAVEVAQPADGSWAAAVWMFDNDGTMRLPHGAQPKMAMWQNSENWKVTLPGESIPVEVARQDARLIIEEEGRIKDRVLIETAGSTSQRGEIRQGFFSVEGKYPPFRARIRYRQWSTYGLIVVLAVQELSLGTLGRKSRRMYSGLRLLTMLLWILGGILLSVVLSSAFL